jgi:hypothetical protein
VANLNNQLPPAPLSAQTVEPLKYVCLIYINCRHHFHDSVVACRQTSRIHPPASLAKAYFPRPPLYHLHSSLHYRRKGMFKHPLSRMHLCLLRRPCLSLCGCRLRHLWPRQWHLLRTRRCPILPHLRTQMPTNQPLRPLVRLLVRLLVRGKSVRPNVHISCYPSAFVLY